MKKHFLKVYAVSFIIACFILISMGNFAVAQNGVEDVEEPSRTGQAFMTQLTQTPFGTRFIGRQFTSALDLALGIIVPNVTISYEVRGFNPFTPSTQMTTYSPVGAIFGQPIPITSLFGTNFLGTCCAGGFSSPSLFGASPGISGSFLPTTLFGSPSGVTGGYFPATLSGPGIGTSPGLYPTYSFTGGAGAWPATSNYPYVIY